MAKKMMFLREDSIIDRVAKCLAPDGCANWPTYRDQARFILKEAQFLDECGTSIYLAFHGKDREVTHEELAAYKAYISV